MPSTDLLEEKIRVILRATFLPTVAVVWGGGQDPPCTEQLVRGARTPGLCPVLSSLPAASSQLLPLREGLQQTKQKRPARRRGWCQTRNDFQVGASTRTRAFPAVTGVGLHVALPVGRARVTPRCSVAPKHRPKTPCPAALCPEPSVAPLGPVFLLRHLRLLPAWRMCAPHVRAVGWREGWPLRWAERLRVLCLRWLRPPWSWGVRSLWPGGRPRGCGAVTLASAPQLPVSWSWTRNARGSLGPARHVSTPSCVSPSTGASAGARRPECGLPRHSSFY